MSDKFDEVIDYLEKTEDYGIFKRELVDGSWTFMDLPYRTFTVHNERDPSKGASYHNLVALGRQLDAAYDEGGLEAVENIKNDISMGSPEPHGPSIGWGYNVGDEKDVQTFAKSLAGGYLGDTISVLGLFTIIPAAGLSAKEIMDENVSQEEFIDRYLQDLEESEEKY